MQLSTAVSATTVRVYAYDARETLRERERERERKRERERALLGTMNFKDV